MTKSSTPPASDLPQQSPKRPSSGRGRTFLVFLFRLLLLGVSGSLAGLVGIVIAEFFIPGQIQEPPLVEKVLQGSRTLWKGVSQFPQSWESPSPEVVDPVSTAPSPTESPSVPDALPSPPAPPPPALTDAQRQQVQVQLNQLQTTLQQLDNQAQTLATEIGVADPDASLEEQLQTIEQRLNPDAPPPSPVATQPSPEPSWIAPATSTLLEGELLKVTLPSDALFNEDNSLRSTTTSILNTIVEDLRRYPGATIRVTGHTDSQGDSTQDRRRSFEQAEAIVQYLNDQLGEAYRWVAVGYGNSQPVTDNTSTINRQRNRRIEIVIDPNS